MIDELSKTLQALLTLRQTSLDQDLKDFFERLKKEAPQLASSFARLAEEFPLLSNAAVKFDRPAERYEGDPSGTVSLFLFDIRENFELRSNEPIIERAKGEATLRRPPRRVACSYLVTAWYGGAEKDRELKEQGLLSQALQVLSRFSSIPNQLLWGSLRDQQPPLPMVTLAADGLKNPAEFWTALGGKLRAAFAVTVTISMPIADPEAPVKLVSEREVRVKLQAED
jgi:hypothetical protein